MSTLCRTMMRSLSCRTTYSPSSRSVPCTRTTLPMASPCCGLQDPSTWDQEDIGELWTYHWSRHGELWSPYSYMAQRMVSLNCSGKTSLVNEQQVAIYHYKNIWEGGYRTFLVHQLLLYTSVIWFCPRKGGGGGGEVFWSASPPLFWMG